MSGAPRRRGLLLAGGVLTAMLLLAVTVGPPAGAVILRTVELRARGTSATVGIENGSGSSGFQRSFNQPYIDDSGAGIEFIALK